MAVEWSQVRAINEPEPNTWDDYERGAKLTFHAGYSDDVQLKAFQHGMHTIFELLRNEFPEAHWIKVMWAANKAANDTQPPGES